MKRLLFLACFTIGLFNFVSAQTGEIFGTVLDENNDGIILAGISVLKDGVQVGDAITDFDGNYSVKSLSSEGRYTVIATYSNYRTDTVEQIVLDTMNTVRIVFHLEPTEPRNVPKAFYVEYRCNWRYSKPLIEPKMPGSRTIIEARDLERMPY